MKSLYLIKRGPKPDYCKAPYHPVVMCARRHVAEWEAGWSGGHSWVWIHDWDKCSGWLITRWNGLDIDYGHVVRSIALPDGYDAAFCHDREKRPWILLKDAVWWDVINMPKFVEEWGVSYPQDEFTREKISKRSSGSLYGKKEEAWREYVEKVLGKKGSWLNEGRKS